MNDRRLTLTSRCMWPWWWRYSKPFKISRKIVAITASPKPSGCAAFNMWRQDPPAMNGMTTHRVWPLTKEQCDFSTLGWSTRTIVCASRKTLFCHRAKEIYKYQEQLLPAYHSHTCINIVKARYRAWKLNKN